MVASHVEAWDEVSEDMGRHSLPDPDDPDESGRQPEEPPTERFGFGADPATGPGSADDESRRYSDDEPGGEVDEYGYPAPSSAHEPPLPPPPRSGPQHTGDWDGGEWTGSHRAVTPARRGVSIGVIVALVSVVVVVGAVILWRFFGDALSSRSDVAAARCVEGEVSVAVVADPAIAAFGLISPRADRQLLARPEFKAMFLDDLLNGSRFQTSAPIHDLILFTREWGFALEDVKVPVRWWHGDDDHIVPFHHGAHVVDRLPDAAMSVIDGESHLGGLGIAEEVLSTVMSLGR